MRRREDAVATHENAHRRTKHTRGNAHASEEGLTGMGPPIGGPGLRDRRQCMSRSNWGRNTSYLLEREIGHCYHFEAMLTEHSFHLFE